MRTIKGGADNETQVTDINKKTQEVKLKMLTTKQTDFRIKQEMHRLDPAKLLDFNARTLTDRLNRLRTETGLVSQPEAGLDHQFAPASSGRPPDVNSDHETSEHVAVAEPPAGLGLGAQVH